MNELFFMFMPAANVKNITAATMETAVAVYKRLF